MHGIFVIIGQHSEHSEKPFCAIAFHLVTLLKIVTMQLECMEFLLIFYNTSLESSFNGKSEYKDVELFRTDEEHPKIASGVNFKQLQLFIQGREVLMT